MRVLKAIGSKWHVYVSWMILSAVFWGWIFTLVTGAPAEKKVTLFLLTPACRDVALDEELEKTMPEGLRQVRAHLFSYTMFDGTELLNADLYVLPAGEYDSYAGSFRPLPEAFSDREGVWTDGGVAYGLPVRGAASRWVTYEPDETYYLFFGINSVHADDGAAESVAESFLHLP